MASEPIKRYQGNPFVHSIQFVQVAAGEKIFFEDRDLAKGFRMIKNQQVLGKFSGAVEINLPQARANVFQERRTQARTSHDDTERIGVIAGGGAPKQGRLHWRG